METKAIHQGGTPAEPPANIAVSRPPPHSAAIIIQPQFPSSEVVQQRRDSSVVSFASVIGSSSTQGNQAIPGARLLISTKTVDCAMVLPVQVPLTSSSSAYSTVRLVNSACKSYSPSGQVSMSILIVVEFSSVMTVPNESLAEPSLKL